MNAPTSHVIKTYGKHSLVTGEAAYFLNRLIVEWCVLADIRRLWEVGKLYRPGSVAAEKEQPLGSLNGRKPSPWRKPNDVP